MAALQDRERARLSPELNAALDEGRAIARADYDGGARPRATQAIAFVHRLAARVSTRSFAPPAPGPAPEGLGYDR